MTRVRLSEEATRYVRREKAYLALYNRRASAAFTVQVKKAILLIAEYPHAGAVVAPVEGVRRLVAAPYHFDYVIAADGIKILSIQHARQGPADLERDGDHSFE